MTTSEQFERFQLIVRKLNEVILGWRETYVSQTWLTACLEDDTKVEVASDEPFMFERLVWRTRGSNEDFAVVMTPQDGNPARLFTPSDIEDCFPNLDNDISMIIAEASTQLKSLQELAQAGRKLTGGKPAFKRAMVEGSYKGVSSANEKAVKNKEIAREEFYASAKGFGDF